MTVESSLVCQACRLLVSQTGKRKGAASQLHDIKLVFGGLVEYADDYEARCHLVNHPDWPKSPATLGKELERCKTTLEKIGINVKHGYYKYGQRYIELADTEW